MSTNLDLYRIDHGGLVVSAGISISSLFTGGLMVLGTLLKDMSSFNDVRSAKRPRGTSNVNLCHTNTTGAMPSVVVVTGFVETRMKKKTSGSFHLGGSQENVFGRSPITFSTLCLCLLSKEKKRVYRQKIFLQIYIVVVVILDLGLQLTYLLSPHAIAIFHVGSYEEAEERFHQTIRIPVDMFPVLVFSLTDGLFIWRCYILQQCLGFKTNYWHHIFWVVPGCFWVFNLAAGITLIFINTGNPNQFPILGSLASTIFASNASINIYATLFICLCLYTHHRNATITGVQMTSSPSSFRYTGIVNLLVQFAVVTVPIAIVTAVSLGLGMGRTTFDLAMIPIAGSSQAFMSVLMIHQVLKARRDMDASSHVESIKLVPVTTSSYELSLREATGLKMVRAGDCGVDQAGVTNIECSV